VNKAQSPLVWRDLLVLLIGEKIEHWLDDIVCGVSVSSRQHCDNYQIWVSSGQDKSEDNNSGTPIKAALVDLLGPVDIQSFYFKSKYNHTTAALLTSPFLFYHPLYYSPQKSCCIPKGWRAHSTIR
jgi:hypothetical protein